MLVYGGIWYAHPQLDLVCWRTDVLIGTAIGVGVGVGNHLQTLGHRIFKLHTSGSWPACPEIIMALTDKRHFVLQRDITQYDAELQRYEK